MLRIPEFFHLIISSIFYFIPFLYFFTYFVFIFHKIAMQHVIPWARYVLYKTILRILVFNLEIFGLYLVFIFK